MSLFTDLASNQMVTQAVAATSGFTLKAGQSHGSSNQCMTKLEANTKYNLSTSAMSAYTDNQLVPKITWQSPAVTSYSHAISNHNNTYATAGVACADSDAIHDFLWSTRASGVVVGDVMYLNSNFSGGPFNGGNYWFHSGDDVVSYQISTSGVVLVITSCFIGSTWRFSTGQASSTGVCAIGAYPIVYYSIVSTIVNGTQLYNDAACTILATGGGNLYYKSQEQLQSMQISPAGIVTIIATC